MHDFKRINKYAWAEKDILLLTYRSVWCRVKKVQRMNSDMATDKSVPAFTSESFTKEALLSYRSFPSLRLGHRQPTHGVLCARGCSWGQENATRMSTEAKALLWGTDYLLRSPKCPTQITLMLEHALAKLKNTKVPLIAYRPRQEPRTYGHSALPALLS